MAQKSWSKIAAFFVLVWMSISACTIVQFTAPLETLEASNLVGTWQANYENYELYDAAWMITTLVRITGVEIFILKADGTYQQIYDNGKGYVYTSPWNKWSLERLPNGRLQVHLEGARYYLNGIEWAEDPGAVVVTWDPATGEMVKLGKGKELILNVNVVVSTSSSGVTREVILEHLPTGDPDSPEIVKFHRVTTPVPITTPVP